MMERSLKIIATATAATFLIKAMPRSLPTRQSGSDVSQGDLKLLSSRLSETVCRVVWNTAYTAWQAIALGQGARQSRF